MIIIVTNLTLLDVINKRDWWSGSLNVYWVESSLNMIFFFFFRATCMAFGNFQARGRIGAVSCQPTPQAQQHQIRATSVTCTTACSNAESSTHWTRPGIKPASLQRLHQVLNPLSHNRNSLSRFLFPVFFLVFRLHGSLIMPSDTCWNPPPGS